MSDFEQALEEAQGDLLDVDFSACKDDFENPAPGPYPVTVESAGPGTSKSGNPVVKLVFTVDDGSYKGKLFASLNINGNAAWKLRKFLKVWGFDMTAPGMKLNPGSLVGRKAIAHVTKESAEFSSVDSITEAPKTSGLE